MFTLVDKVYCVSHNYIAIISVDFTTEIVLKFVYR